MFTTTIYIGLVFLVWGAPDALVVVIGAIKLYRSECLQNWKSEVSGKYISYSGTN